MKKQTLFYIGLIVAICVALSLFFGVREGVRDTSSKSDVAKVPVALEQKSGRLAIAGKRETQGMQRVK